MYISSGMIPLLSESMVDAVPGSGMTALVLDSCLDGFTNLHWIYVLLERVALEETSGAEPLLTRTLLTADDAKAQRKRARESLVATSAKAVRSCIIRHNVVLL